MQEYIHCVQLKDFSPEWVCNCMCVWRVPVVVQEILQLKGFSPLWTSMRFFQISSFDAQVAALVATVGLLHKNLHVLVSFLTLGIGDPLSSQRRKFRKLLVFAIFSTNFNQEYAIKLIRYHLPALVKHVLDIWLILAYQKIIAKYKTLFGIGRSSSSLNSEIPKKSHFLATS